MRKVEIVPYDPAWRRLFEAEAGLLSALFGAELVRIHHVGSTSIPGLKAKPIIDMLAEVSDIERVAALNTAMISSGYTPKGEFGITNRRYFFKGPEENHSHHLHVFQVGDPQIARHLRFRDYLRSHPREAQEYTVLKESLAARFPNDINSYVLGKDTFIKEIDRKAAACFQAMSDLKPNG